MITLYKRPNKDLLRTKPPLSGRRRRPRPAPAGQSLPDEWACSPAKCKIDVYADEAKSFIHLTPLLARVRARVQNTRKSMWPSFVWEGYQWEFGGSDYQGSGEWWILEKLLSTYTTVSITASWLSTACAPAIESQNRISTEMCCAGSWRRAAPWLWKPRVKATAWLACWRLALKRHLQPACRKKYLRDISWRTRQSGAFGWRRRHGTWPWWRRGGWLYASPRCNSAINVGSCAKRHLNGCKQRRLERITRTRYRTVTLIGRDCYVASCDPSEQWMRLVYTAWHKMKRGDVVQCVRTFHGIVSHQTVFHGVASNRVASQQDTVCYAVLHHLMLCCVTFHHYTT